MTYSVKITSFDGGVVVDMTNMNPNFSFDFNNPIIKIPTPMDPDRSLDNQSKWKTVTFNLNMCLQTVMIDFTEPSGLGVLGSAPNWSSSCSTVFEKIMYLATELNENKKILYINDAVFGLVEIEGYRVSIEAGRKDLVKHTLTLPLVANIY
jgi:hypothetical protein